MTCAPAQMRELAPPAGIELSVAIVSEPLRYAARVQNAAYGAPEPTFAGVARLAAYRRRRRHRRARAAR